MSQTQQPMYAPSKVLNTEYPLIDNDPHFNRVIRFARTSDYVHGVTAFAFGPAALLGMERVAPSLVGRGGFARAMRLCVVVSFFGGFLYYYNRSQLRFYGVSENQREVDMDMKEMVAKVKAGEPLYGVSRLTPHMQGVAARQSRYSGLAFHLIPWFNFVNHSQHGVDTAKYYVQAEKELEAERQSKAQGDAAKLG